MEGFYFNKMALEGHFYVIGAIISSVSFLEATINELFSDASDYESELDDPNAISLLASIWKVEHFKFARVLEKYQIALKLADEKEFEPGRAPYQDAKLVGDLRNALVHYRPEWVADPLNKPEDTSSGPANSEKSISGELEKKLQGKFPYNPLVNQKQSPFFPDKCLGFGCAKWAVNSCMDFTDEFFSRLGLNPPYANLISQLKLR